jgi:hypothetical protein
VPTWPSYGKEKAELNSSHAAEVEMEHALPV